MFKALTLAFIILLTNTTWKVRYDKQTNTYYIKNTKTKVAYDELTQKEMIEIITRKDTTIVHRNS